jgi:hypothetical protein
MQAIALTFFASLLYSLGLFVYLPCKLYWLNRTSRDMWAYLSRTRLFLTGLAFLIASPGPGFIAFLISAASVSGSHGASVPDWLESFGWAFFGTWLVIAVTMFGLIVLRPTKTAATASNS